MQLLPEKTDPSKSVDISEPFALSQQLFNACNAMIQPQDALAATNITAEHTFTINNSPSVITLAAGGPLLSILHPPKKTDEAQPQAIQTTSPKPFQIESQAAPSHQRSIFTRIFGKSEVEIPAMDLTSDDFEAAARPKVAGSPAQSQTEAEKFFQWDTPWTPQQKAATLVAFHAMNKHNLVSAINAYNPVNGVSSYKGLSVDGKGNLLSNLSLGAKISLFFTRLRAFMGNSAAIKVILAIDAYKKNLETFPLSASTIESPAFKTDLLIAMANNRGIHERINSGATLTADHYHAAQHVISLIDYPLKGIKHAYTEMYGGEAENFDHFDVAAREKKAIVRSNFASSGETPPTGDIKPVLQSVMHPATVPKALDAPRSRTSSPRLPQAGDL